MRSREVFSDQHDDRIAEWVDWLAFAEQEINRLVTYRYAFLYMRDLWANNESLPTSPVPRILSDWYVSHMTVRVRALADDDDRTLSLRKLLEQIRDAPEGLSRERFLSHYSTSDGRPGAGSSLRRIGEEAWSEHAGGGDAIDVQIVLRDLTKLRKATSVIKTYVDQRVAHLDRNPKGPAPTFAELHSSIDAIFELYSKYLLLLRATSRGNVVPAFQYNWHKFFQQPWLADSMEPPPLPG